MAETLPRPDPSDAKTVDILGFGEPMMEFSAVEKDGGRSFLPGFGGDTSNAMVAAARQGARAAYFTALGDDIFGRAFLDLWDREAVDRSSVIISEAAQTGLYFITYEDGDHRFSYWRSGSAASRVAKQDVPEAKIKAARILHVSGISQGISDSAAEAVAHAIEVARASGTLVNYDTNLRLKLWPLEKARAVIHAAVARADIARPSLDDARQLTGLDRPEDICRFYLDLGPSLVALTMGRDGTMVATREESRVIAPKPVNPVDATGAGDAFDGAFMAQYLKTGDPFASAEWANAAAALSTLGYGAVEPMPTRAAVEAFLTQR